MLIPKLSALFETSLASSLSAAGTTFTLVSATDRDGNALSGLYGFIVDEGSADEEFFIGTVSGTTVTISYRGIDSDAPNTEVTANKKAHRRGASVKITDYPILGVLRNLLNGDDTIPNPLQYITGITLTPGSKQLASVAYAESLANQGAATSSTSTKGIIKVSTTAVDVNNPIAVGDNDTRVPTSGQAAALASTTTPSGSNQYISQSDLQKSAESYAADAGSTDTYAITLSPVPAAYTTGMVVRFKANTINTGAATLNVNTLGAKSILRTDGSALQDGDIQASQIVELIYNGTSFLMLSPVGKGPIFNSGTTTKDLTDPSATQTITHGLGVIPRKIRITTTMQAGPATGLDWTVFTYNGTTASAIGVNMEAGTCVPYSGTTIVIEANAAADKITGTVTMDATNISIAWVKSASAAGTAKILWEAEA
jgi:hypothetical protein